MVDGEPGRVWLITGATSGFGRALAEAALAVGDAVVGAARNPQRLKDLVAAYPSRAEAVELDVTDTQRGAQVVDAVVVRWGRIDVLVNNAGRTQVGALEETTEVELRDLFELHFFGPAALTRTVLPHMRRRGGGVLSEPMPEYAATVAPTREYVRTGAGSQPGDPAKAAQAILTALDAADPPQRLVLGGDAIDGVRARLASLSQELDEWEAVGRETSLG